MRERSGIDPVTFEVLRNVFEYACERMATILQRSSFSPILADMVDFSNAIYDPQMRLLAQARREAVAKPRAFLFHVATNLARDQLRRRMVSDAHAIEGDFDDEGDAVDEDEADADDADDDADTDAQGDGEGEGEGETDAASDDDDDDEYSRRRPSQGPRYREASGPGPQLAARPCS